MKGFLSPQSMFGPPPAVARNAINVQLVMEPLSASTLQALGSILQLHAQQYPIRVGVFFVLPEAERSRLDAPYKKLAPEGQFLRSVLSSYIVSDPLVSEAPSRQRV